MKRFLAAFLILMPGIAHALSCSPPNPLIDITSYKERGFEAAVLIGTLTAQEQTPTRLHQENINVRHSFTGAIWEKETQQDDQTATVDISAVCAGIWCAEMIETTQPQMLIVQGRSPNFTLQLGPCGFGAYSAPTDIQEKALKRCLTNQPCAPADFSLFVPRN